MLAPLEHHDLVVFWVQLFVLVAGARALGSLVRRVGLPGVVGELGAGVLLGPTVFGRVWPAGFDWFLPGSELSSGLLLGVAWVGVAMLLVVTGFETDLGLIRRLGRPATIVSVASIVVPLVGGLAVGAALPTELLGESATRLSFTLFVGVALAVSSLAVVAKILAELNFLRRDFGQITIAAGMANDVVGWLLLGAVAAVAAAGEVSLVEIVPPVLGMAAFLALVMTVGQRGVDRALLAVRREGANTVGAVSVIGITALAFAAVTQWIGVEGVLGAFVAGVVVARSRYHQEGAEEVLHSVTTAIFAPLFFATAGLRVDLGLLVDEGVVGWALVVLAVAVVAKFVGAAGGAVLAGRSGREAVALGAGLNARGTLELVVATVGLALGVLGPAAYTMIVLVPLVTAVLAAVGLRLAARGWAGSAEEQARLAREESLARNVLVKESRALLPTRGGSNSIVAAQVLDLTWPEESAVTLVALEDAEVPDVDLEPLRNVLHGRDIEVLSLPYGEAAAGVVEQARLGYGLVVTGLPGEPVAGGRGSLTPFASQLIDGLEIPLLLVRKARNLDQKLPSAFSRVLVPVAGGRSARAAQELAFGLASRLGTEVVLVHVLDRSGRRPALRRLRWSDDVVDRLVDQAVDHAADFGIRPRTDIVRSTSPAVALAEATRAQDADLLVIGSRSHTVDGEAFLGHTTEHLLDAVDATVAVVVSPSTA